MSPLNTTPRSGAEKHTARGAWPGVCSTCTLEPGDLQDHAVGDLTGAGVQRAGDRGVADQGERHVEDYRPGSIYEYGHVRV